MIEYGETHLTFGALMIRLSVPFNRIVRPLMAGGRPRSDSYVQWKIHIPATIAAQVELLFFDKVRGKPRYGSRHKLLTELLSRWLEEQKQSGVAS